MTLEELDNLAKEKYYKDDLRGALACYAQAFLDYPYLALAYNNYGNILRELGHPVPAIGFLETAVKLNPEDRIAPLNLAIAYLINGDTKNGWKQFESRWRFRNHEHLMLEHIPRWYGEDITGKTLLVTCEEGDGDNIMFCRYTNQLKEMGINVVLQTEINLVKLYKANFDVPIYDNVNDKPEADYWIPILSLPEVLDVNYDNINGKPYLKADKELQKQWKKIVGKKTKPRIAFSYRGRTRNYDVEIIHEFIKNNNQYEWVSLQTGCTEEELTNLVDIGVTGYFDYIKDWHDTSGLLSQVDAVVCVDTGLAHLAGAMGVPCFILMDKYKTCWRWLLNREDTQWYDSVTLVLQDENKDYKGQLEKLSKHLEKLKPKK